MRSGSSQVSKQLLHRQLLFLQRVLKDHVSLLIAQLYMPRQVPAEFVIGQKSFVRGVDIYIISNLLLINHTRKSL
jgi:hypothetical protein